MLQKFQEHITNNLPFLKDKKLLIAISGGIDSVVLAHLLHKLQFSIVLAHCNFNLRGKESDLDAVFVKDLGKNLNLETFIIQFDTKEYSKKHKLSTQLSARKLRYDWFKELVEKHQLDYVLTAHHADDNLETFLINFARGTGLEGLTGIPQQNGNIIRPLLVFSREEINQYARQNNIEWREDASNAETKYVRNKIRHEIVPKLKEINSSLLASFNKTSVHLQQSQQIVKDRISDVSKEIITSENGVIQLDVKKIKALSNPKAYLYEFLKSYGFTEWNDIFNLLNSQSGKKNKTKHYNLLKNRDFLLLLPTTELDNGEYFISENNIKITTPISLSVTKTSETKIYSKKSILVDENLLSFPLVLRRWKEGDYFYPTGMQGKKKLSKYFKDEKLSLYDKERVWLLCSNNNEIIWVIGMRQDRRFLPAGNNIIISTL